jgi:ParB family transcriptional regulator, chromosome partitioning protein
MNKGATIREIEISAIEVLNPRERNQKVFQELVESIRALGLKKPITVAERSDPQGTRYVLVCGQGRMEAFRALGQTVIPAQVIEASDDEAFVMSLVENIARHTPRTLELLEAIRSLKKRGHDVAAISRKTGLDSAYVGGVLKLLEKGEQRLLTAVEAGRVPLAVAIAIARAGDDDGEIQEVMQGAYEEGKLRGKKLMTVKRLIEDRRRLGKGYERNGRALGGAYKMSSHALVRAYNREVERQKMLIRKADGVQQRLAFISGAMARLLADEDFVNLLRAEGLTSMPATLDPGKSGGELR